MLIAFTGGARSGKSTAALRAAASLGAPVTFIATAEAGDDEMADRIERHRADRPAAWTTIEAPCDLSAAVEMADAEATIIVDCMSMWVSNRMLAADAASATPLRPGTAAARPADDAGAQSMQAQTTLAQTIIGEARDLGRRLHERNGTAIVVTNEVGSGVVPANPLGRAYRDLLGSVNQAVLASADRAYLVVAGRLLELRDPSGEF